MIISSISFIFLSIISVLSLNGLGILINKNKKDFLLNVFFGYLIVSVLITFIHFFLKINLAVISVILFTGLILNIKKYNFSSINIEKKYYFFILIFLILIPIFISQKYHEDFGYYHLPYIINLANEKIIFGLGNLNNGFVHNSIWLNVLSLFYFKTNYDFVTLPTFIIYIIFIIYSVEQIISKNKLINSSYFLIICVFYLILKFTRISEFGNDIPALIYGILGIFFFLKYEEESNLQKKNYFFFIHLSFVTFAMLIKFSMLPIFVLTLYIFIRDSKNIYKEIFRYNYCLIYFLVFLFFLQQFIYTGCFIFPSKISCLNVSWFNIDFLDLRTKLELTNKSYSVAQNFITSKEYLVNFNWVFYWLKKNYVEIIEHFLTMLIPAIIFLLLLKSKRDNVDKKDDFKILLFFLLIGFGYWFILSPVYRFGIIYFLFFIFISTIKFYKKKIFSENIFLILLVFFLIFNFSKNLARINQKNSIFFGIDKVKNDYISNENYLDNKTISVFSPNIEANNLNGNGWQGRLCWDIPFMCSYNKIKVNLTKNYYIINNIK